MLSCLRSSHGCGSRVAGCAFLILDRIYPTLSLPQVICALCSGVRVVESYEVSREPVVVDEGASGSRNGKKSGNDPVNKLKS